MRWLTRITIFVAMSASPEALYGQGMRYVDSFLWSRLVDVDISGPYAYCAMPNGLEIVYFGDSVTTLVGKLYFVGSGKGVDVQGNYAYLADGTSGLQIIDVSDPEHPLAVCSYNTPYNSHDVQVDGDFAFVADGTGFVILDVADPTQPNFAGGYNMSSDNRRLFEKDMYLYLANFWDGVYIFDVSIPYWPEQMVFIPTPGNCNDVFVKDTLAFLADDEGGTHIYSVALPREPVWIATIPTDWYSMAVSAQDSFLYVIEIWDGLQTYNVSDPTNPYLLSVYDTPGAAWKVTVDSNYAYIADNDYGLCRADLSDPSNPQSAGSFESGRDIWDVSIEGEYVYLTDGNLKVLDASDLESPRLIADFSFDNGMAAFGCKKANDYVYVSLSSRVEDMHSFAVVDVTVPDAPSLVGACPALAYAWEIDIAGNYAFAAADWMGVQIFDISNPSNPIPVGSYRTPDFAEDIAVDGAYAFVACSGEGLLVLDVSNPSSPVRIGSYRPHDGWFCGLQIRDGYAYVTDRDLRLVILDITDPSNPWPAAELSFPNSLNLRSITLAGEYAFVTGDYPTGDAGEVLAINVADPFTPFEVCRYPLPGHGLSISSTEGYIYVGAFGSLLILQFSPTGVSDDWSEIPAAFSVAQNHPNPFNSSTVIHYFLPEPSFVSLDVYDILGQRVKTLVSSFQEAGTHQALWDAEGMSSGPYYYRIKAGDSVSGKKMTLIK